MITLTGKSVFGGVAIGKIAFYKRNEIPIRRICIEDTQSEVKRFEDAQKEAAAQLRSLYEQAMKDVGESNAMIFEVHQMMLEDLDYVESIVHMITAQRVNAEYAVRTTADNFAAMFEAMDDTYMQARAADVRDVSARLLQILSGGDTDNMKLEEPVIIAADDLVPSETVQLDKQKVLSFITMHGSVNSHTAIFARTMNIPAVIGIGKGLKRAYDGKVAVVDGLEGNVYIDPDEETMKLMLEKQKNDLEQKKLLEHLKGKENETKSGKKVKVCANIDDLSDIEAVLQNDAGGIGLFRSEFLYLERNTYPSEEELFQVYRKAAEDLEGRRVIIRTLDIGADKKAGYFGLDAEENPALGYRAIRICLTRPEIFKTQIRAIYRASAFGKIALMFPMIISVDEVKRIKEVIDKVKEELRKEDISFSDDIEVGVMIETPAAVMISRDLAKEVDFFSIGTNDLTQYTLAIDRQNQKLETFYDPHHPAVLSMIEMTIQNAHAEGKWAGICGELAADLNLTETFLKMDVDELSVAPGMVLLLRRCIREMD